SRCLRPSLGELGSIPHPPEPFLPHRYTLLQVPRLVGRTEELEFLNQWISKPDSERFPVRVLCLENIGGVGKSALTWEWFTYIAAEKTKSLAGRMWWSFYEGDAHFEGDASFQNFVVRALAYAGRRPQHEVEELPQESREDLLFDVLDRTPFL